MAWITGWPDGPPMLAGICDALAGVHGAFAVLAALDQRRHTGEGQQIELAMLDMSVNIAVEQILEYAAYGHLMAREGNRGPTAAPQGAYPCAQPDTWLALAVGTYEEWQAYAGRSPIRNWRPTKVWPASRDGEQPTIG